MNQALLGKQAWKLISNPDSLLASTLLKYCKRSLFINNQPKPSDTWSWKSILRGRDVFRKGMDIQVWEGNQTSFKEKDITFKDNSDASNRCCNFMCPRTHDWDTSSINNISNNERQDIVLKKAFSIHPGPDKLVWKFDHKGNYTVKLAYQVLANENLLFDNPRMPKEVWLSL